jgi:hypothetical protein
MIGRLSLTFDNGPTPGITERILEVLARHGLRVTFFVIGEKLRDKAAAGLLAEMAAAGHWIGNHSLTHSVALGDRPDAAYAHAAIPCPCRRAWSLRMGRRGGQNSPGSVPGRITNIPERTSRDQVECSIRVDSQPQAHICQAAFALLPWLR